MTFIKNNSYILLLIFLCMGFAIIGATKSVKEHTITEITVMEGDTLWGLALHHAENISKDQWMKEVMRLNDLPTVTIKTGEELVLPIFETVEDLQPITQLAGDGR
ncbi:cell division suppressor protein YneA [Sporosarcina beigongshangi]|uniref:cell division suppressor protein YneA n=1 Tax=Sporosarcina beigongshangi TaxID=2782538 RepID=UPI0019398859|nr:LysM peptidoglycan-binding domain-containing protein [Sporosarcina beigongshangi]